MTVNKLTKQTIANLGAPLPDLLQLSHAPSGKEQLYINVDLLINISLEESEKLFNKITIGGMREMKKNRFHQAIQELGEKFAHENLNSTNHDNNQSP